MTNSGETFTDFATPLLWQQVLPELSATPAPAEHFEYPGRGELSTSPTENLFPNTEQQVTTILCEAENAARQIISDAHHQSENIRRTVQREALEILLQQQTEGFETVCNLLKKELTNSLALHWQELERDAARLCIDLAEQILRQELTAQPESVLQMVREALIRMAGGKHVILKLHPQTQESLQEKTAELALKLPQGIELEIITDPAIDVAGAILTSEAGTLDAQIETQIARLREAALNFITSTEATQ